MGCEIRLVVGEPLSADLSDAPLAARATRDWLQGFDRSLSRFKPESELSQLNSDPREEVPASGLLREAVRAGLWAAERTGGLLDPTLVDELENIGYAESRAGLPPAPLAEALARAPARSPAHPRPGAAWRSIRVEDEREVVRRPSGLRFDTGGTGKGLAADLAGHRLEGYDRFAIDCAGDIRIGGPGAAEEPFEVEVVHPLTGEAATTLRVRWGGVATSALNSRVWQLADGGYAHHLIDPSTGRPAWTGLISATALAPTALEAEVLSKQALLSGHERAREVLAEYGGVIVRDDGEAETISLRSRAHVVVELPGTI